ncbi:hypothetical protein [Sphingomonas sanxanigenens]|uniref:DUF4398 domain-containing protein n=1 Tax=Sphingomonas sanxanigenens DSM 19645 = NX02 TaxID=1123269 RepID=W0AAR1_9SPHN|nr:hypothetical protein [Sphingomonas sanxanigenens]AHE54191.1 hypothetical protein NX02_12465 [Sphingomonas sanxanigenens DSM 19645 = NX02]
MNSRPPPLLPLFAMMALSACAGGATQNTPSLARRPIETPRPDPTPTPAVAAETALLQRIAALVEDARQGDAAFGTAAAAAEPRITRAAGAAAGSDAWVEAQQALAAVEFSREKSVGAMVAIDSLMSERLNAMAARETAGGATEIAAAQAQISGIVEGQASRLAALQRRLQR